MGKNNFNQYNAFADIDPNDVKDFFKTAGEAIGKLVKVIQDWQK